MKYKQEYTSLELVIGIFVGVAIAGACAVVYGLVHFISKFW